MVVANLHGNAVCVSPASFGSLKSGILQMLILIVSGPSPYSCRSQRFSMGAKFSSVKYSAAMLWSTLQLGIAITCACLPTLAPILHTVSKQLSQIRSWGSTIWSRSRTRNQPGRNVYKMSQDSYEMPNDVSQQSAKQPTAYQGYAQEWAESQGRLHYGQGQFDQDVERGPNHTRFVARDARAAY